ncbi:type II secretion system F family protein [Trujillonella endophytica]|uniref:Tight adherence protein C n=1 Tax=Trujillonella endophytica TaxID=673521 RepID=A0A1H8VS09_9ACTN|nr:type II secretion system F family protein [Trujillella endophytica]SEP17718.1 tight adherence protein C [Trujillella endophytica]
MTTLPAPVLAAAVAVGLALPLMGWAVLIRPGAAATAARANLSRGLGTDAVGDRAARAGTPPGARLVRALTPQGTFARIDRLLVGAGRPAAWPVGRVVAAKLVLAAAAGVLGILLVGANPQPLFVITMAVTTVVSYFVPELLLTSRAQERRDAIGRELADTLDQMTIAVEAGLGFESALARAGRNGTGPLAEELVRTLQDIGVGQPRREAYLALAERAGVDDLRRFIRAVVQADAYGVSIADVLRTQAQEMRLKRRQRAEEKAMQIPVKVIFPLILCILPTLFIVLLGPTAVEMMTGM